MKDTSLQQCLPLVLHHRNKCQYSKKGKGCLCIINITNSFVPADSPSTSTDLQSPLDHTLRTTELNDSYWKPLKSGMHMSSRPPQSWSRRTACLRTVRPFLKSKTMAPQPFTQISWKILILENRCPEEFVWHKCVLWFVKHLQMRLYLTLKSDIYMSSCQGEAREKRASERNGEWAVQRLYTMLLFLSSVLQIL